MDLIKIENGTCLLDAGTAKKIAEFEKQIKEAEKKRDELKKAILEEMEAKEVIKLDTEDLTITYSAPTTRESLDTKTLREDLPTVYDTYTKISPVKASIRIKVK